MNEQITVCCGTKICCKIVLSFYALVEDWNILIFTSLLTTKTEENLANLVLVNILIVY